MRLSVAVMGAVLTAPLVDACSSPQEAGSATAPPPTTSTSNAAPTADELLSALPEGVPPRVGYTVDGVHVAPDGTRTPLPTRSGIGHVTPSDLGLLVGDSAYFEATSGLRLVTPSGTEALSRPIDECVSGPGLVNADGTHVAWVTFACPETGSSAPTVLHVRSAVGTTRTTLPPVTDAPAATTAEWFRGPRVVVTRDFREVALLVDPGGATAPRRVAVPRLRRPPSAESFGLPAGLRVAAVAREPSGARLVLVERGRRSAVLREVGSGRFELAAPVRRERARPGPRAPAYLLHS